jgi:AraC family transcriptional regulator
VLFARAFGPYERSADEAWGVMRSWLDRQNGRKTSGCLCYGLCHDNPLSTPPDLIRYDACVAATKGLAADPEAGIGYHSLAGGAYAVHGHEGSDDETWHLFSRLYGDIVPKQGLSVDQSRPFVAMYLSPSAHTGQVDRRTELCVPILPIGLPLLSHRGSADLVRAQRGLVWSGA